jgi:hypothetical protein
MSKLFGSVVNARLQAFSEATGSISDEQGGFRPARGTPDQILILREILSSRKELGLPTYATYVDAKKAYDTVWRPTQMCMTLVSEDDCGGNCKRCIVT